MNAYLYVRKRLFQRRVGANVVSMPVSNDNQPGNQPPFHDKRSDNFRIRAGVNNDCLGRSAIDNDITAHLQRPNVELMDNHKSSFALMQIIFD